MTKSRASPLKGRTYEEIHGVEKAAQLRELRSEHFSGREPWHKGLSAATDPRLRAQGRKISKTLTGRGFTAAHCAAISTAKAGISTMSHEKRVEVVKKHNSLDLPTCRCYVHGAARPYMVSSLTWKLADVLVSLGFDVVIPEAQVGRYRIDALLGNEWLGFEADGAYHFNPERRENDKKRDAELLGQFGLPIVRLSGDEVERLYHARFA